MRLTLRTLLAYMDDVLEPARAREIGLKIAESDVATALVERIRDVLRRRRLTAPDVDGPAGGLDPNLIAEYLDNTLPGPTIADVERVCLDSDLHLAEVAACHQILTLALGEPVQVRPEGRERLYALIPRPQTGEPPATAAGGNGAQAPAVPPAVPRRETAARPQPVAVAPPPPTYDDFATSVPEYLRPKPLWKRALPVLLVMLLAGAWLGLLFYDPTLLGLGDDGPAPPPGNVVADADTQRADREKPAGQRPAPQPDNAAPPAAQPPAANAANVPPLNPPPLPDRAAGAVVESKPPVDLKLPDQPDAMPAPPQPPADVAANVPQPMPPEAAEKVAPPPDKPAKPQPAPAAAPGPPVQYVSSDGLLLHYEPMSEAWFTVDYDRTLPAAALVALPEPFQAEFHVGKNLATVRLHGGTAARWLGTTAAGPFGLDIQRGAVSVEVPAEVPADGQTFGVVIGPDEFHITAAPGSRLGVQVEVKQPNGFEQSPGDDWYRASLIVADGSATIADGQGWSRTVAGPAYLSLSPEDRTAENEALASAQPLAQLPTWLTAQPLPPSLAVRQTALQFEKAYDRDRAMLLSAPAIAKEAPPQVAEVAVRALAVTEEAEALTEVLAYEGTPEEALQAAILGLRTWLVRHPQQTDRLRETLRRHFREETADAVYHLLWGYSEEDGRDETLSRELVGYLDDSHVAVRELAIWHLYRLTGLRLDYRPLAPEQQRQAAIKRWQAHLQRNNGTLLPPKPTE